MRFGEAKALGEEWFQAVVPSQDSEARRLLDVNVDES